MGIIFGKRKPPSRVTQQDKAVLQLKQQRDKLKQYQKRIELNLEKDREIAKKLLQSGQKDRAKLVLKKKRYQQQLLAKTDCQLENVDKLTHDIEFAQVELQVVEGLKLGNEALKEVNNSLNVVDIEKILDETREGVEKQNEINDLLSGKLTEDDEDAVEQEFEQILSEQMPEVPSEEPVNKEEEPLSVEDKVKEKKTKDTEPVAMLA